MKRWLQEPLVHFLLIGAALFIVFDLAGHPGRDTPRTIVVTKGQIASLASGFARTWLRPPTPEELDGLIQERIREEVYSREAVALGLDKDDSVIRRRLQQKMEFISEDVGAQVEPTDAELQAYLEAHPEIGVPPLEKIRDQVRREWLNARRVAANDAFYQGLLKKYSVTVEKP